MKHWYRASEEARLPRSMIDQILSIGLCLDCSGPLFRIAYRDSFDIKRKWTAFGYRCSRCSLMFIEPRTQS